MSSRIVSRNQTVWRSSDDRAPRKRKELDLDAEGCVKDYTQAIAPDDPESPFRAGRALWDSEERIVYRCVRTLNPLEGWAPTEFWQRRWGVDHKAVIEFAERGFLDAAVEERSQAKRYRCRDENRLQESEAWKAHRRRAAVARNNAKRMRREALYTRKLMGSS